MAQEVSLKTVIEKAVSDKHFREALIENPDNALASADWSLANDDLQLVKRFVGGQHILVAPDIQEILQGPLNLRSLIMFPWVGVRLR